MWRVWRNLHRLALKIEAMQIWRTQQNGLVVHVWGSKKGHTAYFWRGDWFFRSDQPKKRETRSCGLTFLATNTNGICTNTKLAELGVLFSTHDVDIAMIRTCWMLHVLKKFRTPQNQLITVYTTYIRPLLEYCAPVIYAGLTAQQAQQIEGVQKRALKIIGGYHISYHELLHNFELDTLATRREKLSLRLGRQMLKSERHREMLPQPREDITNRATRNNNALQSFRCGARLRKSAIPHITTLLNCNM